MASRPQFSLATTSRSNRATKEQYEYKKHSSLRRRGSSEDFDASDGNASLTYSATSSVQSGGSATAESTDSSFADIMRVLDLQDTQELKDLIRKEGVTSIGELRSKRMTSGQSVASSLVYSLDGESHLDGSQLQTIAGQPTASFGYDSSSKNEESLPGEMGLLFAPADSGNLKKKKRNRSTPTKTASRVLSTTRTESPSPSVDTPTKAPPSTPPHPRKMYTVENAEEDDEVWYAKWWMFCFSGAGDLMPKR